MLLMKKIIVILMVLVLVFGLVGCSETTSNQIAQEQQELGVKSIVQNQPVPDLGGYSFERDIVIQTYVARNQTIATYTYFMTFEGRVVELCASVGYPIPYSTQLTSPESVQVTKTEMGRSWDVLPQSEPNGLFPPSDAAATLVQCVNPDGTVSPMYFEDNVFAMPYRIHSDVQLQRYDDSTSFSVEINK
jgi:hypothetical protein